MFFDHLKQLLNGEAHVENNEKDIRRAVAGLLVHASRIDGNISPAEEAARDRLLKEKFDLADGEIASLVMAAESEEKEAVDFYHFTRTIKDTYDREHRGRIIEMLWEIVLADGVIEAHEANLVWRVSGILGFTTRENGDFRRVVQERLGQASRG